MNALEHVTRRRLLARLIDSPELPQTIRALPERAFSALVRRVGVEDAGELVCLATTSQLVTAFDEDLFTAARPGAAEHFSVGRFVTWLEVLLEAGADVAADRFAELSEDFVAHAFSSLAFVLDHDLLLERLSASGRAARRADKLLESALCEELDGYLLVSKGGEGWDALLSLVLALDARHRPLLERLLDRCAAATAGLLDDLDELCTALDSGSSLADDVEAEREERRARLGFVEPRAAKAFLKLARQPQQRRERDPLTATYLRALEPSPAALGPAWAFEEEEAPPRPRRPALPDGGPVQALRLALQTLRGSEPRRFDERVAELAYLANVLTAGEGHAPVRAAEVALATVARGAERLAGEDGASLAEVITRTPADVLFRFGRAGP